MEQYREFAQVYDQLIKKDIDYHRWYQRILEIFAKYNRKPKTILEMACGTGNLTKYLCEDGYSVTAFDYSEEMLSIAYDKLKQFKNLNLIKQNMINFNIGLKFDAILCVCDSINYINDYKDLCKLFMNIKNHLNDKGLFIFDINSYHKLKDILGNNIFIYDDEDIFYTWENNFDDSSKCCEFYLTFFIKEGNLYRRFDEIHVERAYEENEIKVALQCANLKLLGIYDEYSENRPSKNSERLTFIVEKIMNI